MMRGLVYAGAQLVSIGINNPKKFPRPEEFIREKTKRVVTSIEERRAIFNRIAGKSK